MQTVILYVLVIAVVLLFLWLFIPWLNTRRQAAEVSDDDSLEIRTVPAFRFDGVDSGLATRIREAINAMGAVGDDAEELYQKALSALADDPDGVLDAIAKELEVVPDLRHLDRWALIQLLAELKALSSIPVLDDLLSREMPAEKSRDPHRRSTLRQETINLTTAVEAVTRIAADGDSAAVELLRKQATHKSLSVRRASIQGYLAYGGEQARDELLEALPKEDHYLLDVRQIDVREAPPVRAEPGPTRQRKAQEVADVPRVPPTLR